MKSTCKPTARAHLSPTESAQSIRELLSGYRLPTGTEDQLQRDAGEKVVLFGWHREVYSLWLDRLADLNPALYTGSESPNQKAEAQRRFVEGETPVLIMSLRSGAGVDGLQQHARTVVFGELDWSPGVHEQCTGRIHRDGQPHSVVAYFLLAENGSDPIVADVLGIKRAQIDGIRDLGKSLLGKLDTGGGHIKRLAELYLAKARPDVGAGVYSLGEKRAKTASRTKQTLQQGSLVE